MADASRVAVVIVSYNVRAELARCLRSLASAAATRARTVVVDNASSDGTPQMLRDEYPWVMLIEAGANLGFSRANNLGIRATDSELVLLLNPDTHVRSGAIDRLVATLTARPDAAAVGPRLVDEAGVPEISFGWAIGPLGELKQKLTGALYARRLPPVVRWVERRTREPGPRQWVSGACLLIRRADLEAVGLLDERYFMYTEDVDLCGALVRRGRLVLFEPASEVQHLRGRSASRNPETEFLRRRSQVSFYEKHHPGWVPLLKAYLKISGKRY